MATGDPSGGRVGDARTGASRAEAAALEVARALEGIVQGGGHLSDRWRIASWCRLTELERRDPNGGDVVPLREYYADAKVAQARARLLQRTGRGCTIETVLMVTQRDAPAGWTLDPQCIPLTRNAQAELCASGLAKLTPEEAMALGLDEWLTEKSEFREPIPV